uniref:Integral membrane protein 2 n=1 Tax=Riptortus pedestris TaxID=329032 RepID=R4WE14_RIPPE|nr:conserved hypothetical protein [Riptortus pedestris]
MTIVTKPLSEKKGEKPLVDDCKVDVVPEKAGGAHVIPLVRASDLHAIVRERRARSASTACLFITALVVMGCGVITGLYLYKQFVHIRMEKFQYRCNIPYDLQQNMQSLKDDIAFPPLSLENKDGRFFHEDFEIEDNYEKISVPDFSGGRRSKFIHDFKTNKTGIIDVDGHRCFVMPLNRTLVLPPETLIDLVKKMREGYYEVDTGYVRETMQVITPAVEDRASLGRYIEQECFGFPIYKLEKIVSGVFKRSAEPEVNFMEFAGKNTQVLHIVNYKELQEHEDQLPVAMA